MQTRVFVHVGDVPSDAGVAAGLAGQPLETLHATGEVAVSAPDRLGDAVVVPVVQKRVDAGNLERPGEDRVVVRREFTERLVEVEQYRPDGSDHSSERRRQREITVVLSDRSGVDKSSNSCHQHRSMHDRRP